MQLDIDCREGKKPSHEHLYSPMPVPLSWRYLAWNLICSARRVKVFPSSSVPAENAANDGEGQSNKDPNAENDEYSTEGERHLGLVRNRHCIQEAEHEEEGDGEEGRGKNKVRRPA